MPNGVELSIALAQNLGQKNEMPLLYSSYGGYSIARQVELLSNFPWNKFEFVKCVVIIKLKK